MQLIKQPKSSVNKFGAVVMLPDKYVAANNYPLIVFLAGQGGIGDGTDAGLNAIVNGEIPQGIQQVVDEYCFIVIAPQTGSSYSYGEVDFGVTSALVQYPIDQNKMYLTGNYLAVRGCKIYCPGKFAGMGCAQSA